MNEVYKEMIDIAERAIELSDTLDVCRVLASILARTIKGDSLSIKLLASCEHLTYFTNIEDMLDWLKQVIDYINKEVNLTEVNILLPNEGNHKTLDTFNTTHQLIIVSEEECLVNLDYHLEQLWFITRSKQSYYTRILNPSLVHVYNYLMVYIRIMENEQR